MSIKWMIKKSDYNEIRKSVNKDADNKKLEALKKEVIAILEKKDSQELKKAIEYFEQDELRYSHLEKSLTGEWIEKAGYGVGTVRIWKGKKYKKVSSTPTRWVRVFDKNDRGASTSMGRYIAQVKKCESVEELYQFCMKQRSLFQDENGNDLPIMDKLRSAIDSQSNKIENEKNNATKTNEYMKEDLANLKAGNYSFGSFEDFKAEINKQAGDKRGAKQPNYIGYLKISNDDYLKKVYDAMPKAEKYDDDKAFEEYKKLASKEDTTPEENSRIGELVKEHFKHSDKKWPGGAALRQESENKTYWIQDFKGNRITSDDAKNKIKENFNKIDALKESFKSKDKAGQIKAAADMTYLQDENQHLLDRLNADDCKEMESESEKHQNRSDAMKGNKNAWKGGPNIVPTRTASMDEKDPIAKSTKVAEGKVTIPNEPEVKKQMKQLIASRYSGITGSYSDMLSDVYYDGDCLISTDAKVMKIIKIGNLDGIEPNSYVKIDISGKDNIGIEKLDKQLKFPNYKRVVPNNNDQTFSIDNKLAKEKIESMKRDGSINKKVGTIALEFDGDAIKLDGEIIGKTNGTTFKGNNYVAIQADYILGVLGNNGDETNFNASDSPQRALTVTTNVSTDVLMPMVAEIPDYEQNRKDYKENAEFEAERKEAREKEKADQDARRLPSNSRDLLIKNRPEGVSAEDYGAMVDYADDFYVKLGYDNSRQMASGDIKRMIDTAINQINNKDYKFEEMLLNSDNKVSRKIFEMLTGERVGTNKQAAQRAWESWVGKEAVDAHNKKLADDKKAEEDRIAAEKKAKDDAEREQYHGFMDGKTPAGKGKAKDILEKRGNFGGKIMTYQELADKYIADGGHASTQTYQTSSGKDKNYYYVMDKEGKGYEIPKTIYDYAMHISGKSVKKSFADIIMLDEYEHDELEDDYSDYDASQPDLFNSTSYKVGAALDSIFGC